MAEFENGPQEAKIVILMRLGARYFDLGFLENVRLKLEKWQISTLIIVSIAYCTIYYPEEARRPLSRHF